MITRTLSLMFLALGLALATPLFSQQDAGSKLGELMGDFQRTTKKLPTLLEDEPNAVAFKPIFDTSAFVRLDVRCQMGSSCSRTIVSSTASCFSAKSTPTVLL